MDSKVVNKEIKSKIWIYLKNQGFTQFTARNAWRTNEETIEVVNIQSFNSYLAEGVGCTTFSFALNLGVYYKCYETTPWFNKEIKEKVQEYDSHARFHLKKHFNQEKLFHPGNSSSSPFWEKDRLDIWYVKEDGSNLDEVINEAKETIISDGLIWLKKMTNLQSALGSFEEEVSKKGSMSWPYADIISTLSLRLENPKKAKSAYESIASSPYYRRIHENRKKDKKPTGIDHLKEAEERIELLKKLLH